MNNLTCEQCGFANDHTRVFCQNCGTRLPAPENVITPGQLFIPSSQQAPESIRRPIKPVRVARDRPERPGRKLRPVNILISSLIYGACLAAVIEMARTPDGIPSIGPANGPAAEELYLSVTANANASGTHAVTISQDQVNNFLAARVLPAGGETPFYQPKFVRVLVNLGSGDYRFVLEEKVFNWPVYIAMTQTPVSGPPMTVNSTAGTIGRLPIHPLLLPWVERLVDPMLASLGESLGILAQASTVLITPDRATIVWKGTTKSAP